MQLVSWDIKLLEDFHNFDSVVAMIQRNPNFTRLSANYLFPEITRRKKLFLETSPTADLISLGIGDTTEPIPPFIVDALTEAARQLGTKEGYSGYGPEQGQEALRQAIAHQIYKGIVSADDIFISDGAKCDIGRLQLLFGPNVFMAVQDPSYPVYVDGSLMQGVKKIVPLPCHPNNHFWPDLENTERTDLIYWCSPNNPTGAVSTKAQLKELVDFAKANQSIILFDSAYANYIQDPSIPRSIFEIPGAESVALEMGSFSKLAGFSGVRLGWTVVPAALKFNDGSSVKADWKRLISTIFNGASNISQAGGMAVLSEEGLQQVEELIQYYLKNAKLIKQALIDAGYQVFGGENAPYLWVKVPDKTSWEAFQRFLENSHLVTTPGSGFGPMGEGYLRFSAFGHRDRILKAVERISEKILA